MKNISEFLKTKKGKIIGISALAAVVIVAVAIVLLTDSGKGFRTVGVSEIVGTATVENNGKEYTAYVDMKLQEGYLLTTATESYVRMVLDEDKYIKLEEDSRVRFDALGKEGSGRTVIVLEYGAITNEVASGLGEGEEYIINTPNTVLAIKGTFFRVEVRENEDGEILTDVLTYGGVVKSQRILPSGEIVEENVLVEAGYKTTISMNTEETVYVVEKVEEGKENVEAISLQDIPDGDLVDMYVASSNGHEMFINVEEIWDVIEEREIEIEDYTSNRDGQAITPPVNDSNNNDNQDGEHKHTEVTVTQEPTCTEDGFERVECSECGEVLSEKLLETTGHNKETIIEEATETEEGKTTVKCTVCDMIFEEIIIPANHSHTYETVTTAPTCTIAGETVTRCAECLYEKEKTVLPATGHNVEESVTEATFTQNGQIFKYCTVCSTTLELTTIAKFEPIYTDDGNIYITEAGFYTSRNPELIPYTGKEYLISQKSENQVTCSIYFEDNPRMCTVTMDGINISGTINVADVQVGFHGTQRPNTITAVGHDAALKIAKGVVIYKGTFTFTSSMYAVEHTGFQFAIFGGVVTMDGGVYDVYGDGVEFIGGSIRLMHGAISGTAVRENMELECRVYDYYPSEDERAIMQYTYEQWYDLQESDVSSDGKYYIWMPKYQVRIDEYHFPDSAIRQYLTNNYDNDMNGYLTEEEVLAVTEVVFGLVDSTEISSLEGIEYFPNLEIIQCSNAAGLTEIDISQNPNLTTLHIYDALITKLDLSNNLNLQYLTVNNCVNLTKLDVSNCTQLKYLDITDCPMAYINLENTSLESANFESSNNVYQATGLSGGTFDAKSIDGIDISKISNVTGADYDPTTGMFTNITGTQLEFVYDCGNGIVAEFVLKFN